MPIDQRRAIVRAETLIAFEPFQSTETTRYYLNGTCIRSTKAGPTLIATDGHTLIVMRDPDAHVSGLDTIWNCEAKGRLGALLTKVRKQPGVGRDQGRDLWVDLQYGSPGAPTMTARVAESAQEIMSGGGEPQLLITDRSLYVDGTFPQYDRIFPKAVKPPAEDAPSPWTGPFSVQPAYVLRMVNLAKTLGGDSVVFGTTDTSGPTIISIGGLPNLRCLIMPVRIGEAAIPFVPEWIVPLEPVEDSRKTVAEKVAQAA